MKGITFKEEIESDKKACICEKILKSLPEWFVIEESIKRYIEGVKGKYFVTAYDGENPIGFISILEHNEYTNEIYVMGILKEYHRKRIGKELIKRVIIQSKKEGKKYLTVKTLSDSNPDDNYEKTRQFYLKIGFIPLEEFKTLWGENNPCLFLIKKL